ncbi:TlpA disulfide reductase family protein, partial [Desulfobacterales bacterium HSG17]|nr:TlpA disulfide reductase family protein [Desulfobacterales bacterium HSG17]
KKLLTKGDILPSIKLVFPDNDQYREYLGISEGKSFSVPQIVSDLVIIEIFSMYCPHCQREAPLVNSFYDKLANDPDLKNRIKLIGIGVGNSDYEVNFFKKKYDIKFPLFSDPDFKYYEQIGEVRTPFFIGIKIAKDKDKDKDKDDDKAFVFHTHKGGMENVDDFLADILNQDVQD